MSGMVIVPDPWTEGPGAERAANWLQTHGYDMVALPVLDLLSAVARLEQAAREPGTQPFILDRLFTCDLPRLRQYLPPEALEELDR